MLGNNTKTRIPETLWSNDRIWVKQNEDETYNSFILIISFYNDFSIIYYTDANQRTYHADDAHQSYVVALPCDVAQSIFSQKC